MNRAAVLEELQEMGEEAEHLQDIGTHMSGNRTRAQSACYLLVWGEGTRTVV